MPKLPVIYSVRYSYDNKKSSISFRSGRVLNQDLLADTVEFKVRKRIGVDFDPNKLNISSYNYEIEN